MSTLRMTALVTSSALLAVIAAQAQPQNQDDPGTQTQQQPSTQSQQPASDDQMDRSSQADTSQADRQAGQRTAATTPALVTMLVIPTTAPEATRTATQNGCWARLYDNESFQGDSFTLVGPIDMSNMQGPFGVNWADIDSIQAGPRATVTIYDNVNFRDRAAKIKPAQEVPELNEKMGFFENVRSLRIACPGTSTG